jgi:AraC family transcriptional regulator
VKPSITTIEPRLLVGVRGKMSLAADRTGDLWRALMPRRTEIGNRATNSYLSIRVYPSMGPEMFAPDTVFEKWAAVEVTDHSFVPDGMEAHTLAGGRYAVFEHLGPASAFPETMRYIFTEWLPESGYELDSREQFEELTEDWNPMDPEAREQVWIPIR